MQKMEKTTYLPDWRNSMPVHNSTSVLASIVGRGLLAGFVELSGEHISNAGK